MCGIAGLLAYGDGARLDLGKQVKVICDAMASRGPDGSGEWVGDEQHVAFGHRRLAIIDLSQRGSQPMIDPERGLSIVFNGEIYNYQALRADLAARGYRFRSTSDTEVLLFLYAEYGTGMCDRLRGMYAFAIYDQTTRRLLLARDPFGIKPLYYSDDGKVLRFASQVKALLAGSSIDTRPEPAGYVGYYLWGSVPEPYTLFRGIRSLKPGSLLSIDSEGRRSSRTCCSVKNILSAGPVVSANLNNDGDRLEYVQASLLDSVRHHLVADVPVGVFLSAGVDSGCLVSLARAANASDLRTVTIRFEGYSGTSADEGPGANARARKYGTLHEAITVTYEDFEADLAGFLDKMDQPTIDGFNTFWVSKAASTLGMKVCLSGLGADEMFAGYSTFTEVPRLRRLANAIAPFPSLGRGFRWVAAPWIGHLISPKYAGLLELGRTLEGAYLLRRGLFMPWELPDLLAPEILREGWQELACLNRLSGTAEGLGESIGVAALEMCWYMRNQLLRDSDWTGMAHSVEIRLPFVDVPLLQRITPYLYGVNPLRKSHLAEACGLARDNRSKTGFVAPVREWLMKHSPTSSARGLRDWASHVLSESCAHRSAEVSP